MPYKDPEKKRAVSAESNRRWRERFKREDPDGFREYTHAASKKHRDARTPEQREEVYRKRREWQIRTGRLDPNKPPRVPGAPRVPARTHAETIAIFAADASDPRHGTANGYKNLRCRCEPCTTANASLQREYRERRLTKVSGGTPDAT